MMIRGIIIGMFCSMLSVNIAFAAIGTNKNVTEVKVKARTTEDKNTDDGHLQEDYDKKKPQKLMFNGTFRYLYGQGRMEGKLFGRDVKEKIIMPTWRTRLYVTYKADEHWNINGALEDNRVLNDHAQDDTVHWHRGYAEGIYPKTKILAGRFGYKLSRGNVMDTTADGLRLRFGESQNNVTAFMGRIGSEQDRREGYILNAYRLWNKKIITEAAYVQFKNTSNPNRKWNEQKVLDLTLGYQFAPDVFFTWEYLRAKGKDRDSIVADQNGYVFNFNYGDYDYTKKGSYRLRVRYYRQPQASIIVHTMNGYPGFFDTASQHLGMRGWGLCWDYVLAKGILLTLEGYDLKNLHTSPYADDFRERILGGSITFAF
ncbi:MAG: hypothetical protein LKE29_04710 [Acidaminococcaceae bacterium]|nr:hypothetical protein [Acidaminococcaceae bacterium]